MNDIGENTDAYSTMPYQNIHGNIPTKAYYKQRYSPEKNFEFDFEDDEGSSGDNSPNAMKKSSRACKGKRYMEFMNAQRANPIIKKCKQRTSSSSSSGISISPVENLSRSAKTENGITRKMSDCEPFHCQVPNECPSKRLKAEQTNDHTNDNNKFFDANDFDLEEKIKALPSRNLDKYLSRKRDTKKKKRSTGRRSNFTAKKNGLNKSRLEKKKIVTEKALPSPRTVEEAKAMIVGSQKRKARKESITKRVSISEPDIKIESPTNCASNLLFLATIAEANANLGN